MSGQPDEDSDKPHEPTPEKLRKAREKGEIARAPDVNVTLSYIGLLVALAAAGTGIVARFGSAMMGVLERAEPISYELVSGRAATRAADLIVAGSLPFLPIFLLPAAAVLLGLVAQRGIVFAPDKLKPKRSRISPVSVAKQKFGASGLFDFAKSFIKLTIYSTILAVFFFHRLEDIASSLYASPAMAATLLARLCLQFLAVIVLVSLAIGAVDLVFQHHNFRQRNRMSRKEITDETKEAEGDPHMKSERRHRGTQIAQSQMMSDIPGADVVIVNPTHYAVVLKWSRKPGSAPVCVAKGVDEMAMSIRQRAAESAVPIHSDPPTARALHATTEIGAEIGEDHYQAVAAAIRFAESMRKKSKARGA